MPIFESLKGSSNANATLDYCEKEHIIDPKTGRKINKCVLKAGVNCDIDFIRDDFEETREMFHKNDGRQAMHFVLSFDPKELPNTLKNQEKCLEIGMELAARIGKNHESGCFIHADQDHLHCHIVTNTVNYETGHKFQMKKHQDLAIFRNISDQICKEHGIEPLEAYKGETVREKNAEKRIKARGGKTWKDEVREAITYAKERSTDMDTYKKLLVEKGVEMYERGENTKGYIHIGQREAGAKTYKLRDRNKALDGGYHLDDVLQAFEQNKQKLQQVKQTPEEMLGTKKKKVAAATDEKRTISMPSSLPSFPKNDGFEETIQQTQEKKAAIKENTMRDLKAADDEAKRIEIKKNEQMKLQQAEIDKQIELKKQNEIEEIFKLLQRNFPRSTYKTMEHTKDEINLYMGGATKRLYKVSYEKEFDVVSIHKKDKQGEYQEQSITWGVSNSDSRTKAEKEIENLAQKQETIARQLYRQKER